MIRITSISGQVFFQPEKKSNFKVEKIQPIEGTIFHERNYTSPNQSQNKTNEKKSNETFESILKNEINKII